MNRPHLDGVTMRNKRRPGKSPTELFFAYEMAVLSGNRKRIQQTADALRTAGFFVRRLPGEGRP
jgi:hypothetical protein